MKGLDCAHCAEEIRKESEKLALVKKAEMNFMAKKLMLEIASESEEAVTAQVKRIVASLEPDVEVIFGRQAAAPAEEEDSGDLKRKSAK